MKITHFMSSALVVGGLAMLSSGCFATRMVRTDTVTSYDLIHAQPTAQADANLIAPAGPVAGPPPQADGTLVVEALVVPPPPASAARPVRLPDAVASAGAPVAPVAVATASGVAPAWDPLPSYVAQFQGSGWLHRPLFGGPAQTSSTFGRWGGRTGTSPPYGYGAYGYGTYGTTGAYGSASPHFSSSPSFSGSVSSHFSGGYPGSGY